MNGWFGLSQGSRGDKWLLLAVGMALLLGLPFFINRDFRRRVLNLPPVPAEREATPEVAAGVTEVSFRPVGVSERNQRYEVTVYLTNWTKEPLEHLQLDVRLAADNKLLARELLWLQPLPADRVTVKRVDLYVDRADSPNRAWAAVVDHRTGAYRAEG